MWIISKGIKGIRSIVYQHVDARDHDCFEPICSANNDPICIYCAKEQPYVKENKHPQCNLCADKPAVTKRLAFVHIHLFFDKFLLFI